VHGSDPFLRVCLGSSVILSRSRHGSTCYGPTSRRAGPSARCRGHNGRRPGGIARHGSSMLRGHLQPGVSKTVQPVPDMVDHGNMRTPRARRWAFVAFVSPQNMSDTQPALSSPLRTAGSQRARHSDVAGPVDKRHAEMVFVADDLAAWLIFILAGGDRKTLTTVMLGDDQERALRLVATAAVQRTACREIS
jgi:hypothetical protein